MSLLIALSSALIIAFLLFINPYYQLHFNKVAFSIIVSEIFSTIAAAFISLALEKPLNIFLHYGTPLYSLMENILTVGFIEELAKFFAVYLCTYGLSHLKRIDDLMLDLILSACTFAAFENTLYVLVYDMDLQLAFMRSMISTPCHLFYSIVLAFFYIDYLEEDTPSLIKLLQALFFSSFFHGFMNFCLSYLHPKWSFLNLLLIFFIFPAYVTLGLVLIKNHFSKLHCLSCKHTPTPKSNFCIHCGAPIGYRQNLKSLKSTLYIFTSFIGLILCLLFLS